ncbi:MAG: helix-turn-helix domain-containing protein [Alphaproteobacteria bacterium]|nr:helix-turn-helix domain-containing protein [Alphaproteobacteria bacterium]MCL2505711.1 helix-turn-helix domain-containing protein [Alphaproteobacteria bacterium]
MKTNLQTKRANRKQLPSQWLHNLCALMEDQGLNPRRLSLLAGLNSTAVRDMLDGRAKFPRYSTIKALADALGTTPALLMADPETADSINASPAPFGEDVELLTEIIARLQEILLEMDKGVSPREFAAMAATIYKNLQEDADKAASSKKTYLKEIKTQIYNLCDYNFLRKK